MIGFRHRHAGWWAAYQFDSSVTYFGGYIESKLTETDERTHKSRYTLEGLLGDAISKMTLPVGKSSPGALQKLMGIKGMGKVTLH